MPVESLDMEILRAFSWSLFGRYLCSKLQKSQRFTKDMPFKNGLNTGFLRSNQFHEY